MKLTIFTPTYNRGGQLVNLYNSILAQTNLQTMINDFEWLIIDDGSVDNTKEVVEKIISENKINIRYFYKENGGKHTAHNYAVDKALGEFFLICDSDDVLTSNALQILFDVIDEIKDKIQIAGMVGYRNMESEDGKTSSKNRRFPPNIIDSKLNDLFMKDGVFDTVQIYKTSILKIYKFPQYKDERFFPENWCWKSIDKKYLVRVIPEVLETGKYQSDGLSVGSGSDTCKPYKNSNAYADYAYLYYETTSNLFKRLGYYGKYKTFQRYGKQAKHKEKNILNIITLPFQVYFDKKYFGRAFKRN